MDHVPRDMARVIDDDIDADIDATMIVAVAARQQLDKLNDTGDALLDASRKPDIRSGCVAVARALRLSEAIVLQQVCEGDNAGRMFGIKGWAKAAKAAGL